MNREDADVANAERDASPVRWNNYDPDRYYEQAYQRTRAQANLPEPEEPAEAEEAEEAYEDADIEATTAAPLNATRSQQDNYNLSRTQTQSINTLEQHPTALERIETHRSQHLTTVGTQQSGRSLKRRTTEKLPDFGGGKPYPPALPDREEYVVEFSGHDDPLHPQNWTLRRKLFIGTIMIFDALTATVGSSIFSPATAIVASEFGVDREVTTLGTSLFVLGYAFGPLGWGPFSELYGRRMPIVIASFGFGVFAIGVATAKDLQTILICRFFCGLFGSSPLAVVAAVFTDIFDNKTRGLAVAVFSASVFIGPLISPFVGGFIVESYLGWRWTEYISAIMGFTSFVLVLFFLPESYPPVVLVSKAAELRRRTKNWGIHAKQEEVEVNFKELIINNVSRPMRILFTEPIVLLITIYMSFLYGLLYLFLTAYAIVFQQIYGFNAGVGGLTYFGMVIGELIAFGVVVLMNSSYVRKLEANDNVPVPEWRLPIVVAGGISFAIGLFWFGWTGYSGTVPWIVPTLSGLATGFGIFSVFLQLLNYIIDAYLMFAASAIAANTFMRSLFGAVFPLFATYMYQGIGVQWANTLLGCFAVLLIPLPVIFLVYGKRIRAKSKFAPALDLKHAERKRALAAGNEEGFMSENGEAEKKAA